MKFFITPYKQLFKELGLAKYGPVQTYIDNEVMRLSEPYVPMDTGMLRRSVHHTEAGSGLVVYATPYAKKQYYEHSSMKYWFERMKADHAEDIANGAREQIRR